MDNASIEFPSLGIDAGPQSSGSVEMFSGAGQDTFDFLSGDGDMALVKPPSFVTHTNDLAEIERKREEEEKEAELQRKLAEQKAYEAKSDVEVELPVGSYSDSNELVSKVDVYDMLERGSQVVAKQVSDGEEFELPAIMLDLKDCPSVYPICLDALKSFCKETSEKLKCSIYIRNNAEQVFMLGYGDINELHSAFPDYVNTLFGEEAKVKNILRGEDGLSKLKKLSSGIKTFRFNLQYTF